MQAKDAKTAKQRQQVGRAIAKARGRGEPWPTVKQSFGLRTATQGRALMREAGFDTGNGIAASYARTPEHRARMQAAQIESAARKAGKPAPRKPRKATPRKPRSRKA